MSSAATPAAVDTVMGAVALSERPRSLWRDAMARLHTRKLNYVYASVLAIYALVAIIAFTPLLGKSVFDAQVGAQYAPPAFTGTVEQGTANEHSTIRPSLWLGTDIAGRSVLYKLLYGTRVALTVSLLASILSVVIGTVLGLLAGYYRGWVDALITWLYTTINSIPWILLMVALAYALKDREFKMFGQEFKLVGIPSIVMALGLTSWVGLCRLMRGEVLKHRERDYVAAAKAVGAGTSRIIFRHILPNTFHLVIIDFTLGIVSFVQAEVILSFLGLGVKDQPSWGVMIDDAKLELMRNVWWQFAGATAAIFGLSICLNFLGDALRDALDPRLRGVD
ncbi:MAG: putative oligopeptide transport system permease protein [Phycisphaerales bacterium]|nr:putative oligopeptide transport system permease protein [Phycisphaerales bacterium]